MNYLKMVMARVLKIPFKTTLMKTGLIVLGLTAGIFTGFSQIKQSPSDSPVKTGVNSYPFRKVENKAFKGGEVLKYRIHYGIIDAGVATLKVLDEGKSLAGRKLLHIVGTGESKGTFDFFFKVRDRYESYIDAEGVFPWLFVRRVDEGGYKFSQDYKFLQHQQKVDNGEGKSFNTPDYIQDMVSGFYFARTLNLKNTKIGDTISVNTFVDDEIFPLQIRYAGTETVSVSAGTFNCLKFHPVVQKGRVFKSEDDLTVYISNDENKIPVLVRAKVLVGSIKMEITDFSGLANKPAIIKK